MNFYYSEDAAQRQNPWVLTIIGALAIAIWIYAIIVQFAEFSWLNLLTISLLFTLGIYNFTTGIRLLTKTPAGRNFVYVDDKAIYIKKELEKLQTFEWDDINKISIRRSGIQIHIHEHRDTISYNMLPYREVKKMQTTLIEFGQKKEIPVTLDMDNNLETV